MQNKFTINNKVSYKIIYSGILKTALFILTVLVLISAPVMAGNYGNIVFPGETVFIGESGLDVSATLNEEACGTVSYYSSSETPGITAPSAMKTISDTGSFYVSPEDFSGKTGAWYKSNTDQVAFYVEKSSLSVSLFNYETERDITNSKAITGDQIAIRINSNLDSLFDRNSSGGTSGIDCYVETPDGATLTRLYQNETTASVQGTVNLGSIRPVNTLYWIPAGNKEKIWTLDQNNYKAGTYKVYANCNVNGMKDNLGTVTGVTKSEIGTLQIDKDTVTITADRETLVRNNDFTVTIEGAPKTDYVVWLSGTNSYSNKSDYPPKFLPNQDDVTILTQALITPMVYKTDTKVSQDVAYAADGVTNEWAAKVTTGSDGSITVGLTTDGKTKDAVYTIRAEKYVSATLLNNQPYDTVKVKVEKGAVTVTASGDGLYYLGEEATFSGKNTDSDDVYLFITGPNLPSKGGVLTEPQTQINTSTRSDDYTHVNVKTDNTWELKWDTSDLLLDAGTYTIYATSQLVDKENLEDAIYDTISIVVKKPFATAKISASTIAKGDKLYIHGTAEGKPTVGVAVWVLGKNYWNGAAPTMTSSQQKTETVNDNGSFVYEIGTADTQNLAAGQYFVVIQHPMYNKKFDVIVDATTNANTNVLVKNQLAGSTTTADNSQFIIWGTGKLQGSDAAEALIDAINSPDIDDTYYKLTFFVEEPWIRINSIGEHCVGDQFTLTGTTNLAVGNDLIVEITSSSFQPTQITQPGEFSGASSTVQVVEGTTYNEWSMDVDASSFKPDEYIVKVEAIEADATATKTFNLLKGTTPTSPSGTVTFGNIVATLKPDQDIYSSGENISIAADVSLTSSGDSTFPASHSLEAYTELDNPKWYYTILINGNGEEQESTKKNLIITGYLLEYPSDQNEITVRYRLEAEIPEVSEKSDRMFLELSEIDGSGNIVSGGDYIIQRNISSGTPEPTPTPVPGPQFQNGKITLNNGWNFISTPKKLDSSDGNNTAGKLFGSVDSDGHSALMYNATSRNWENVRADTVVKPLEGIWIYSNNSGSGKSGDKEIKLTFSSDPLQTPPSKELSSGWNAVGFSALQPATAKDTMIDVSEKWTKAIGWDAENQMFDTSIVNGGSGIYSDTRDMNPAEAYWVWMKEEGTIAALN